MDPKELTNAPLQFDIACDLNASVDEVFDVIVDFENMPSWMPLMKRVEVDNTNASNPGEVGSVRVIYPPVGKPTLETVTAFERPKLLAYSAADEALMGMFTDHTGILTCEPNQAGGTHFRWRTYAQPGRNPIMRFFGRLVFGHVFRHSFKKLKQRFNG